MLGWAEVNRRDRARCCHVAVRGTPAIGPDSGPGRAVKRVKMILEEGERGGKPLEN